MASTPPHFQYDSANSPIPPSPHTPSFNNNNFRAPNDPPRSPSYSSVHTAANDYENVPTGPAGVPLGASVPRFYGHPLDPNSRTSFQSSNYGYSTPYQNSEYGGSVTHLPVGRESTSQFASYRDDPAQPGAGMPMEPLGASRSPDQLTEKRAMYSAPNEKRKRSGLLICGIVVGVLVVAAGVLVPLWFFVLKGRIHLGGGSGSGASPSSPTSTGKSSSGTVTGGAGSKITLDDGTSFVYNNAYGGQWYANPLDPFNNAAKANSWTPALNEPWKWGVDKVYGVNIGGWLVTEPFISPALYQKYYGKMPYPVIDEFSLSQAMAANGGVAQLENHYKTFITEQDFAQIAAAGLNFVRIPLAFWSMSTWDDEPYLEGVSWKYFLKAIQWCRKYGLRINLDFHAVPGSQNGWNHSGRFGQINFLNGVMGIANAQRTLDYIRTLIEFISQPQYKDVVVMFGVVNEAMMPTIGQDVLSNFYLEVHDMVRNITGFGQGNGPMLSIHDGFQQSKWKGWLPGADRFALDTHTYLAFGDQSDAPVESFSKTPCSAWGVAYNASMTNFGFTGAGEWSLAINDCGTYVNGVDLGTRYEGTYNGYKTVIGSCDKWNNWTKFTPDTKAALQAFALAQMDAFQNWFFWTWKIGNSTDTNQVNSPFWSYSLGLQQGWMPTDPRASIGTCAAQGVNSPFVGPLQAWQTGGAGAGTVDANSRSAYSPWPVTALANIPDAQFLPTYTPTGTFVTLTGPALTAAVAGKATASVDVGNGWVKDLKDGARAAATVVGCNYPDRYSAESLPVPTATCGDGGAPAAAAGGTRGRGVSPAPEPLITAAPQS